MFYLSLLFIFVILFIVYSNSVKLKNLFITSIIESNFILKEEIDKNKLKNYLDTFEIFNYNIYYNFFILKSKYKSYLILDDKSNEDINNYLLIIKINNNNVRIIFNHMLFDMNLIFNIINGYFENDHSFKKIKIHDNIHFNIFNYLFKKHTYKTNKLYIPKKYILDLKKKLNNSNISTLDILFAIQAKNIMSGLAKDNLLVSIVRSYRKKNKYILGNYCYYHAVKLFNKDIINIAEDIRKSYNRKYINFDFFEFSDCSFSAWNFYHDNIISITNDERYDNSNIFSYDNDNYIIN